MCRWLAYSGTPIHPDEVLYKPQHSLIDQSLHSRMGAETTNGDGFGIGWYAHDPDDPIPGVFHGIGPAWNNANLRELSAHGRTPLFFAHIRASTGTDIQETNCHPFRHDRWLWMHNGAIARLRDVRRDLMLEVEPSLFPEIRGTTDSEIMFYLALTYGLQDDPPAAVERMVGLVEAVGHRHGIEYPIQMTIATSDGDRTWAFRYSSAHQSRTLFYSQAIDTLRAVYPDNPVLHAVSDETRLIVSEPLGDLPGVWIEVPESHWGVVQPGADEMHPFTPRPPD